MRINKSSGSLLHWQKLQCKVTGCWQPTSKTRTQIIQTFTFIGSKLAHYRTYELDPPVLLLLRVCVCAWVHLSIATVLAMLSQIEMSISNKLGLSCVSNWIYSSKGFVRRTTFNASKFSIPSSYCVCCEEKRKMFFGLLAGDESLFHRIRPKDSFTFYIFDSNVQNDVSILAHGRFIGIDMAKSNKDINAIWLEFMRLLSSSHQTV